MKNLTLSAAVAAAIVGLAPASSRSQHMDDPRFSGEFHTCMDRAGGVTAQMRDCMNGEQDKLEGRLNDVYRDLMSAMPDGDEKETLRNSERAWITHRQTECAFEASEQESGTLKPVLVAGCWLKETADRVDELEKRRAFDKRWR